MSVNSYVMKVFTLLSFLVLVLNLSNGQNGLPNKVVVGMKMYLNASNHWITEIGIDDEGEQFKNISNKWIVNVEQNRSVEDNSIHTIFHITAPTVNADPSSLNTANQSASPERQDGATPSSSTPRDNSAPTVNADASSLNTANQSASPERQDCPVIPACSQQEGFLPLLGLGSYKIPQNAANFDDAITICQQDNAELLNITSKLELKAMRTLLYLSPITANTENNEAVFIGDQVVGLNLTPDSELEGEVLCPAIRRPNAVLTDIPCNTKVGFICVQR